MKLITKDDKLYVYDPSKDKYYLLSESDLDFVIDDSETDSDGKPKLLSDEQVRRYLEDKYGPKKKTKEQQKGFYSKKADIKDEYAKVQKAITDNEFIHSVYDTIKKYNKDNNKNEALSSYDIVRLVKNPTLSTVKSFTSIEDNDLKNQLIDLYTGTHLNKALDSSTDNSFYSVFPELIDIMLTGNSDIFETSAKNLYMGIREDIAEYQRKYGRNPQSQEARTKWKEIMTNLKKLLKDVKLIPKRTTAIAELQKQIQDTIELHKNALLPDFYGVHVPSRSRSNSPINRNPPRLPRRNEVVDYPNLNDAVVHYNTTSLEESYDRRMKLPHNHRENNEVEVKEVEEVKEIPMDDMSVADIQPIPIESIEQIQQDYKDFDNSDLMKDPDKVGFQKAFRFMKWVESEPEYLAADYDEESVSETDKKCTITIKDDNKPIYKVYIIGNNKDPVFNELINPIHQYLGNEINQNTFTKQIRQLPSKLSKKTGKNEGSSIKFQIEPFDNVEIGDENVQEFIESHEELFDPTKTTMEQFLNYLDGLAPERRPAPELPHYPEHKILKSPLYPQTMDETKISKEDYEKLSPNNGADKSVLLGTLTKGLVTMDQDGIKRVVENSFSFNPFSKKKKKNNRDYSKILGVLINDNRENAQYRYKKIKDIYTSDKYEDFNEQVENIIDQFADKQYRVYGYPGELGLPITNANNDWDTFNPNAVQQNLFYDYMYRNTDNMFSKGQLSRVLMKKINSRPLDRRPYSGIKPDGHDLANILKMTLNAHN